MTDIGYSQQEPSDTASDYNTLVFVINQLLGKLRTCTVVKVLSVTNDGGVSPVGFVDVQPMVNYVDGIGNAVPHGSIFNLPYFRLQGGTNAFIIDPAINDIGIAVISDRDISAVKNTLTVSNPGSLREFDLADGIYIGGILNGTPINYIGWDALGNLNIKASLAVNITAPGGLNVNGTPVTVP
jgi:hypothetical protein